MKTGVQRNHKMLIGGNMDNKLRIVNTLTLIGILIVLVLILMRLPQESQHLPTLGDIQSAQGDQKRELMLTMPIVQVERILTEVRADVTNYELSQIQSDISSIESDVSSIRSDVSYIR
jgi:hypothetical protein